jgi:hypothetical protein
VNEALPVEAELDIPSTVMAPQPAVAVTVGVVVDEGSGVGVMVKVVVRVGVTVAVELNEGVWVEVKVGGFPQVTSSRTAKVAGLLVSMPKFTGTVFMPSVNTSACRPVTGYCPVPTLNDWGQRAVTPVPRVKDAFLLFWANMEHR